MFSVNSTRPESFILKFQWLWFSNTCMGASGNILQKLINSFQGFLIGLLPIEIVFPRLINENVFHCSSSSFWNAFLLFNFSIAESSRFSLAFDESSCWVAANELYSSIDMITTPVSLPLLIIRVSKFWVTLSRYFLISFLKSDIVVVIMASIN